VKQEKLVSIAIATYKGEKYIKEQIESILNQTYKNLEIIICDDNSTDNTFNILKEYAKKDKRIKLYKNKQNLGYVKNFEKAISLCHGDYIALSDQDDIWLKEKIKILLDNIGNFDLIHSDTYLIDENGEILHKSYSNFAKKQLNPKDIIELAFTPMVTGCTCMFTKSLRNKVLPFCNKIDVHDLWISLVAFKSNGIKYYDKALIKYRQHSNNQIGALKYKYSIIDKIKKINNINLIKKNLFKYIERNYCRIKCIKKLDLTESETYYLNLLEKRNNYLISYNIKYFYYTVKIIKKVELNKSLFKKYVEFFTIYFKYLFFCSKDSN